MKRNVGRTDRIVRAVVGVGLLAASVAATLAGRPTVATLAVLGSTGLLFNAAVGWCGVNALLGVDTCSQE